MTNYGINDIIRKYKEYNYNEYYDKWNSDVSAKVYENLTVLSSKSDITIHNITNAIINDNIHYYINFCDICNTICKNYIIIFQSYKFNKVICKDCVIKLNNIINKMSYK